MTQATSTSPELQEFETVTLRPYFEFNRNGVYFIAVETDKDGTASEKPPLRLSDTIEIIGRGTDSAGNHYRVIKWRDNVTNKQKIAPLSMADIGTNAGFQALQQRGIMVHSGRRKRELLADYLQADGATTPYHITDKSGWHGKSYILPNGEILNPATDGKHKNTPQTLYNGDTSQAKAYTISGSLKDWQNQVSRFAAGNSRLCLAIGASLAAPLLSLLHEQNGGFHLYGDSSDGKTTAAKVALSVWGEPESLKLTWRGTDIGFSNAALARNDNLLVLDEIGEADPRVISKTAYSVINGKSKLQGAKDGGNRHLSEWRIMLFSTGEYALQNYLERAGIKWEAGQAVRLPSLPAATQYGIFDTLHGFRSGAALSDNLLNSIETQHGTAGRAWIAKLQTLSLEQIQAARDVFLSTLPDLDGQALRIARRFAIVAAALELATDITGLAAGVGMAGIRQCFDDWRAINGTGKYEDRAIIENAINFMQLYADSMRFVNWDSEFTNHNHAGYRRESNDKAIDDFWVNPFVFETEILKGVDKRKGCLILSRINWLQKPNANNKGGYKFQRFGKGRFYVLHGIEPPYPYDDEEM